MSEITLSVLMVYGGADIAITLSQCVCVYVCGCVVCILDNKTKTPDHNNLKLGTVVVLDCLSKPIDFEFKSSRVRGIGSLACLFR